VFETASAVRKRGKAFRLRREVEATDFVRSHTSIPVARVLDVHLGADDKDMDASATSWILMERLPGDQLGEAWPAMSEDARAQTISQLKSYFGQLHAIRPADHPGWIGSCSHGPAYDHRLDNRATCGPFKSIGEFHDFLVAPVRRCPRPEWVAKYRSRLPDGDGIIFAHADVSWENILVGRVSGSVTGILDWEMAGFWPEWWEYRKALFGARSRQWWIGIVKEVMQEYPSEAEIDMELEMF
jgi:Phosphotransferase enzyme family